MQMDKVQQLTKGRVVDLVKWLVANHNPFRKEVFELVLVPSYLDIMYQ